jgi:hypothetical protein
MKKIKIDRMVNQIARLVIGLHEQGYNYDFELDGESQLWGAQENRYYVLDDININNVYETEGQDGKAPKFILAIETGDGCKGLLMCIACESVFLNNKTE